MNHIFQRVEADVAVSITELKRNPAAVLKAADEEAIAILSHNKVVAYIISPAAWEYVQELHDDAKIVERLDAEKEEAPIRVNVDEI